MGRVECILSVTLQLFLVAVVCVLLPWAQGQTSAPGIGVSGNKIIATTGGTLGLHAVSAGQVLDLRGVNFSGSEYTCSRGTCC